MAQEQQEAFFNIFRDFAILLLLPMSALVLLIQLIILITSEPVELNFIATSIIMVGILLTTVMIRNHSQEMRNQQEIKKLLQSLSQ